MRNLTKDSRLTSRAYQFEKLIEGGYLQETYKELDFFTKDEGKYFTLKVYRGTAANHIEYINYRTAERRAEVIQSYKNSYENRIKYKAEQKEANNGKTKITLATLKTFLNKNEADIYIKIESRFDGMQDCVTSVEDDFSKVVRGEDIKDNNLGFAGLWLVGSSRDSISIFENNEFTGFTVWNCCGSCIVATKKEDVKELQQNTTTAALVGKIQVIDYSERAIAVIGETKPIKEKLKELGGSFNPRLTCGAGWIFPKTKLQAIKDYLTANKEKKQTEVKEPLQVETEILPTPQTTVFKLEYFKIIWHEGRHIEGATFENATFTNWEDVQKTFVKLWEVNEKGQDGGYTKVKCEIKFLDMEQMTDRIDITNKINNGDFNPSQMHIVTYLQSIADEEEVQILQHPEFAPNHPLNICDPQSGQYKECVKEYLSFELVNQ